MADVALAQSLFNKAKTYQPTDERKTPLDNIAQFITQKNEGNKKIFLNFICTHNSRRSHLAAVMAQLAAEFFRIPNVNTFSGGTEATAFHENSVNALTELGIDIKKISTNETEGNPHYKIKIMNYETIAFSKKYSHSVNPSKDFAAILVCSSADSNCPIVIGAEERIYLPYEDPKIADGTTKQNETYKQRAIEIGIEMFWVFSQINN